MIKKCLVCGKKFETRCSRKYCSVKCSSSIIYYKKKGVQKETLCWKCKNACGGCSWSRAFIPVKDWTAYKTTLKGNFETDAIIESYFVHRCPQFIKDRA